ncbi:acetylxylan esterase [Tautonia plasticadhaerens]|uniref:Acetyl xylan esterase (AXE1) n=1 Tax=Tautonia plasticadhaerens TaxID=2527974 RepID=A0A518H909_9BACT|nr:acetylxylan esterase [Tautonia plasticadhaerens]QDV37311.1 hypothetical protein ElP_52460 [Tautonia plasticadhaerens]
MIPEDRLSRRSVLQTLTASLIAGGLDARLPSISLGAEDGESPPLVFPDGQASDDRRLGPLNDLNGYFPFLPPGSVEEWAVRAERVRRRILVAAGLWPMPTTPELVPVVHGPVGREGYTVEKVYFESFPGLFVTGSLYRPTAVDGLRPGVLCPHGHWQDGRFHDHGEETIRSELEAGAERFEVGGRHPVQARCVQLSRMGCVVFLYDMIGYADSVPITYELAHRFSEQRPELSSPERWGLFSAQAELRLQNVLGLQLLNSIRALDFLSGLADVDPDRIAVTGSSGGGTQTFLLSAVDSRPAAVFPAVMVSTAMQGGCTCENASYLRIDTGNVEFAALVAPRPLGMTGANDWTREIETKGLPELTRLYELLGAPGKVSGRYLDFGHNYNAPSRAMMYSFLAEHLGLGPDVSLEERDYEPLTIEEASVWDEGHPKPPTDQDAEVRLLVGLDADASSILRPLRPVDRETLDEFRRVVGGAIETMVGRSLPEAGDVVYDKQVELDKGDYLQTTALLRFESEGEAVPAVFLYPKDYRGRVVLWVDDDGKSVLHGSDGNPVGTARRLMEQGICVVGCDLLGQGESTSSGGELRGTRSVENPREFLGYTLGYNHPLFAQRVHDILSVLAFVRHHDFSPGRVDLLAPGRAGRWAATAVAVAGDAVDSLAVGTGGFRFAGITEIRDLDLFPGAVKYGDLPSMLALCAPTRLWLSGESPEAPELVRSAYESAGITGPICFQGDPSGELEAAVSWLLEPE